MLAPVSVASPGHALALVGYGSLGAVGGRGGAAVPGGPVLLDISSETFPISLLGEKIDAEKGGWNTLDGFSPMAAIHTYDAHE